jgi:hypothetical protein
MVKAEDHAKRTELTQKVLRGRAVRRERVVAFSGDTAMRRPNEDRAGGIHGVDDFSGRFPRGRAALRHSAIHAHSVAQP